VQGINGKVMPSEILWLLIAYEEIIDEVKRPAY
jgi:hypothetical protein